MHLTQDCFSRQVSIEEKVSPRMDSISKMVLILLIISWVCLGLKVLAEIFMLFGVLSFRRQFFRGHFFEFVKNIRSFTLGLNLLACIVVFSALLILTAPTLKVYRMISDNCLQASDIHRNYKAGYEGIKYKALYNFVMVFLSHVFLICMDPIHVAFCGMIIKQNGPEGENREVGFRLIR